MQNTTEARALAFQEVGNLQKRCGRLKEEKRDLEQQVQLAHGSTLKLEWALTEAKTRQFELQQIQEEKSQKMVHEAQTQANHFKEEKEKMRQEEEKLKQEVENGGFMAEEVMTVAERLVEELARLEHRLSEARLEHRLREEQDVVMRRELYDLKKQQSKLRVKPFKSNGAAEGKENEVPHPNLKIEKAAAKGGECAGLTVKAGLQRFLKQLNEMEKERGGWEKGDTQFIMEEVLEKLLGLARDCGIGKEAAGKKETADVMHLRAEVRRLEKELRETEGQVCRRVCCTMYMLIMLPCVGATLRCVVAGEAFQGHDEDRGQAEGGGERGGEPPATAPGESKQGVRERQAGRVERSGAEGSRGARAGEEGGRGGRGRGGTEAGQVQLSAKHAKAGSRGSARRAEELRMEGVCRRLLEKELSDSAFKLARVRRLHGILSHTPCRRPFVVLCVSCVLCLAPHLTVTTEPETSQQPCRHRHTSDRAESQRRVLNRGAVSVEGGAGERLEVADGLAGEGHQERPAQTCLQPCGHSFCQHDTCPSKR